MLSNLRRWLHYYFLVRGFNFLCLIDFDHGAARMSLFTILMPVPKSLLEATCSPPASASVPVAAVAGVLLCCILGPPPRAVPGWCWPGWWLVAGAGPLYMLKIIYGVRCW